MEDLYIVLSVLLALAVLSLAGFSISLARRLRMIESAFRNAQKRLGAKNHE